MKSEATRSFSASTTRITMDDTTVTSTSAWGTTATTASIADSGARFLAAASSAAPCSYTGRSTATIMAKAAPILWWISSPSPAGRAPAGLLSRTRLLQAVEPTHTKSTLLKSMPDPDNIKFLDTQLEEMRSDISDLGYQVDSYKTKTAAALGGGVFLLLLA